MLKYWEKPEFRALKKALHNGRLAAVIVLNGCTTFEDFCAKFTTRDMLRMRNFGERSLEIVRRHAFEQKIKLREEPMRETMPKIKAVVEKSDNDLFLHCSPQFPETVMLAIGSRRYKRSKTLTADEALKLAYWLMSLAKGGETHGLEKFGGAS
jgi:hypothetical protein